MKDFIIALMLSLSLCADCLAVSLCSGPTMRGVPRKYILSVSALFAVVHVGFLTAGYLFGDLFVGYVDRFAHWIGFLLLLYVGCSMLFSALAGKDELRSLEGLRNILVSAAATSIDALAVGVSLSMERTSASSFILTAVVLFVTTLIVVLTGLVGGRRIGARFGRKAEIVGGLILVGLGIGILI